MNPTMYILVLAVLPGLAVFGWTLYKFLKPENTKLSLAWPETYQEKSQYALELTRMALAGRWFSSIENELRGQLETVEQEDDPRLLQGSTHFRTVLLCCLSILETAEPQDKDTKKKLIAGLNSLENGAETVSAGTFDYLFTSLASVKAWFARTSTASEELEWIS